MSEKAPHHQTAGRYPAKDDVEWAAVDRYGRLGIFTTGGDGPIPRVYLMEPALLAAVSEAIWALSERSETELLSRVACADDFLAFARRGCFAFDWADVHRVSGKSGRYELQARPLTPLTFATVAWPEGLRSLLESSSSESMDFTQLTVDVSQLDCAQGS